MCYTFAIITDVTLFQYKPYLDSLSEATNPPFGLSTSNKKSKYSTKSTKMDNYEYTELLKNITSKMQNITGVVEPEKIEARLREIEKMENDPEFWNDAANAAKIQKEKTQLSRKLEKYRIASSAVEDAKELYEMAKEESDEESLQALYDDAPQLEEQIRAMEIEVLLSGESDASNAILSIHPGAGGTESQDWASMLLRMYKRWAERHDFKVEVLDYQTGEEAGIKDATILIKGENAYGYLKVENGIHRLVRISPFDSNAKRHTSFSSVMVSPEIDDDIDIVIEDKDIRIDTYRASGAGGQHVNKTESAIRITHIPTGVVVQCQNDRSQHKNKATALKMLKSRLYELELEEQKAKEAGVAKSEIGWGHQIRSYVMQPYQQVKDTRSNEAYSNVSAILDGDLDKMIEGVLIAQNRS
jgi:peptide chain release factor 2